MPGSWVRVPPLLSTSQSLDRGWLESLSDGAPICAPISPMTVDRRCRFSDKGARASTRASTPDCLLRASAQCPTGQLGAGARRWLGSAPTPAAVLSPAFSPDGPMIAAIGDVSISGVCSVRLPSTFLRGDCEPYTRRSRELTSRRRCLTPQTQRLTSEVFVPTRRRAGLSKAAEQLDWRAPRHTSRVPSIARRASTRPVPRRRAAVACEQPVMAAVRPRVRVRRAPVSEPVT